ncbi:hypothetical protein [Acinetobacter sp. CS-2]|jgi:hypothetical protein|uniref:hypothetical protein n=1 Tax=unclassified Acinetobacter TaxID=196816 RepID=UPI00103BAF62|nr:MULTISPECIES: hypothetical protein [Acinetobacter]QQN40304.1 hypothetical protein JFY49_05110 [Acinetobacter sp. CS-2]QQN40519.1 hypothetical protein JFY49_06360 [Acinetobacter sp. CS-2]TCH64233.1 hypothetical protein E0409_06575 [Acinetobacter sp. ANC 4862]
MTVDELKLHYGVKTDSELAQKVGYTKGAVSKWRSKGISLETQALLQLKTKGKVKANLQALTA